MDGLLDYLHRFASDLLGRADGPMTLRLFLQPTMALIAARHDDVKDAKLRRDPCFHYLLRTDSTDRIQTFREGVLWSRASCCPAPAWT